MFLLVRGTADPRFWREQNFQPGPILIPGGEGSEFVFGHCLVWLLPVLVIRGDIGVVLGRRAEGFLPAQDGGVLWRPGPELAQPPGLTLLRQGLTTHVCRIWEERGGD